MPKCIEKRDLHILYQALMKIAYESSDFPKGLPPLFIGGKMEAEMIKWAESHDLLYKEKDADTSK